MNKQEFNLLIRSFDEVLSAPENQKLDQLLDVDPDARREIDIYRRLREIVATDATGSFSPFFVDRVVKNLTRKSTVSRLFLLPNQLFSRLLTLRTVGLVSAAVVILIGIGILLQPNTRRVDVPFGSLQDVSLPDGSAVTLSSGSTFTYQKRWDREERLVHLDGEAFFHTVALESPFIVETFNARVVVTGTEFNVRAWREEVSKETAVTVASGRVEVHANPEIQPANTRLASNNYVSLLPGQSTTVLADTTAPRRPVVVTLEHALAWRTGGLVFSNRPLVSVFNELERRFDIEIVPAGREVGSLSLVYLNPNPASAESVLSDICHTLDLQYQRTANGFEVFKR